MTTDEAGRVWAAAPLSHCQATMLRETEGKSYTRPESTGKTQECSLRTALRIREGAHEGSVRSPPMLVLAHFKLSMLLNLGGQVSMACYLKCREIITKKGE